MTFFDLRVPLGWLFTILGTLMVIAGFLPVTGEDAVSMGVNINLYWGIVMIAFGLICLWLARGYARKRARSQGER